MNNSQQPAPKSEVAQTIETLELEACRLEKLSIDWYKRSWDAEGWSDSTPWKEAAIRFATEYSLQYYELAMRLRQSVEVMDQLP